MKSYEINYQYTNDDILYIVYNNRSMTNVVKNFFPKFNISNILLFNKIDNEFKQFRSMFSPNRELIIESNYLDLTTYDFIITPNDIKERKQIIIDASKNLSEDEYNYLKRKGFTDKIIEEKKLGSLSSIKNIDDLNILGATTHPIMNNIFDGGLIGGGITIPLFDKYDNLINVSFRKISDYNKLKYTHSCPDVFIWGLDNIEFMDTIWLVEGVFDKYALETQMTDSKIIATSSGSISPVQYWKIISKRPGKINIISDNDQVGLRTSMISQMIFRNNGIECDTYYFNGSKDACEHILEKKLTMDDLIYIEINNDLISNKNDYDERIPFNFFDYLKNRKF